MITYIIKQTNDELMNWYSSHFFLFLYVSFVTGDTKFVVVDEAFISIFTDITILHIWWLTKKIFAVPSLQKGFFLNANSIYSHIEVYFLFLWLQKRSANWCFLIKCTLSRKCTDRAWNLITNVFVFCKAAT